MIEIGRLCVKIAGRDSNKKCVIVDLIDERTVLIDGETRRKKCNINHLEILEEKIDIQKGADHKKIIEAFKKLGIELKEKKAKTVYTKPLKKRVLQIRARTEEKQKQKEKPKTETKEKKAPAEKKATKKEKAPKKTVKKETLKKEVKEEKKETKEEPKKA